MNTQSRFECLTDDDLDQISGGMSCDRAVGLSKILMTMSDLYGQMGMPGVGLSFSGQALGVLQGACT